MHFKTIVSFLLWRILQELPLYRQFKESHEMRREQVSLFTEDKKWKYVFASSRGENIRSFKSSYCLQYSKKPAQAESVSEGDRTNFLSSDICTSSDQEKQQIISK
jgi:hypothetical protein